MTKLLNRGNVFVVVRSEQPDFGDNLHSRPAAVGVFADMDEADDYKGMCEQQWRDRCGSLDGIEFEVQLTTYYG
jgi:hypothetical protein